MKKMKKSTPKNLNNWTVCYVVGLSSLGKVEKFFSVSEGGNGLCFCCVFCPLSREGNPGLHSTPSNYSRFYGKRMTVVTLLVAEHSYRPQAGAPYSWSGEQSGVRER